MVLAVKRALSVNLRTSLAILKTTNSLSQGIKPERNKERYYIGGLAWSTIKEGVHMKVQRRKDVRALTVWRV